MALESLGLSLHEAARRVGIRFSREMYPADRHVLLDGLNFHYLEWGERSKPTIVMLHGAAQQAHSWDFISLALADRYHVLAVDQRGHGDSDWAPDGDYSLDTRLKDMDKLVRQLGLHDFILLGHSLGGISSFVWASQNPDKLRGLVVVDVGPEGISKGGERIRNFTQLPDELDSPQEFAERIQAYTGRPREQILGSLKYSIRQRPDGKWTWKYDKLLRTPGRRSTPWPKEKLWACLPLITCPTLVIRGGDSDIFAESVMQKMTEVMPRCTGVTVPKAGHLVAGDNPLGFLAALEEFLRSEV